MASCRTSLSATSMSALDLVWASGVTDTCVLVAAAADCATLNPIGATAAVTAAVMIGQPAITNGLTTTTQLMVMLLSRDQPPPPAPPGRGRGRAARRVRTSHAGRTHPTPPLAPRPAPTRDGVSLLHP